MHHLFVIAILISMSTVFPVEDKENRLFIGDLIHRDSPMSPFYNHSATPFELSRNSLRHSINRADHLSSTFFDGKWFSSDFDKSLPPKFLMALHIGSNKDKFKAAIDLTSNLLWGKPGTRETLSNTYVDLPAHSEFCAYAGYKPRFYSGLTDTCEFSYRYMQSGWIDGLLGKDSIYLRERGEELYEFKSVAMGVSLAYTDNWDRSEIEGVIGLGRGPLSFVRQKEVDIQYKFSYCLSEDMNVYRGKIIFGSDPSTYETKTFTTPMVDKNHESLYQISLRWISIKSEKTTYLQSTGYMILDPGTEHTLLRRDLYREFLEILNDAMKPYESVSLSTTGNIGPCYSRKTAGEHIESLEIIFHFDGGEISLSSKKTFAQFGSWYCCTILPHDKLSIFGSMAQVNFKVEYNLHDDLVSFTPTDCKTFPRLDQ